MSREGVILDFFAGSGSTGHAAMEQNAIDGGNRRFALVQLPEHLSTSDKDQRIAAEFCGKIGKPRTIAELTKERLRRAGSKIKEEAPMFPGDIGFRVFKLETSNIRAWDPDREDLDKTLLESIEHIKQDRSEADVLYELLLKLGLDLCVPIERKELGVRREKLGEGKGHSVHSVGGGVLLVCLSAKIATEEVEPLALGIVEWRKQLDPAGETTVVFRDSAFADDVAKTNLTAILEQNGLGNVRSL